MLNLISFTPSYIFASFLEGQLLDLNLVVKTEPVHIDQLCEAGVVLS